MQRNIITTSDGSKTIQIEEWNEQYHSIHGAIQEANHVFLKHGLLFYSELVSESPKFIQDPENETRSDTESRSLTEVEMSRCAPEKNIIYILEIGFGTGLNAFLTLIEAEKLKLNINYVGVEAYPVELDEIEQLNYVELISKPHAAIFEKLHDTSWEASNNITSNFQLEKQQKFFKDITIKNEFNIIYFDAFGARVQPD